MSQAAPDKPEKVYGADAERDADRRVPGDGRDGAAIEPDDEGREVPEARREQGGAAEGGRTGETRPRSRGEVALGPRPSRPRVRLGRVLRRRTEPPGRGLRGPRRPRSQVKLALESIVMPIRITLLIAVGGLLAAGCGQSPPAVAQTEAPKTLVVVEPTPEAAEGCATCSAACDFTCSGVRVSR